MTAPQLTQEQIAQLAEKAKKVRMVITDIDGVLSDGKVYLDQADNELKCFNIKDGLGIKFLLKNDIIVAVITGRESNIVERRMKELGVTEVHQNQPDKRACFNKLLEKYQLDVSEVAYLGDDLPDLPLIKQCGLGVAVADCHWFMLQHSDWITASAGGQGAFRELSELILSSQEKMPAILDGYLN